MFFFARIVSDTTLVLFTFVLAYLINFNLLSFEHLMSFPVNQYANHLIFILLVYLISFNISGLYKTKKGFLLYIDEFIGVISAVTLGWAFLVVATFIRGEYEFSRQIILLSWPINIVVLVFSRELLLRAEILARAKGYGVKRAVIIGAGELAKAVAERIQAHPSYGVNFVGFIGEAEGNIIGKIEELETIVKKQYIQVIYVADKNFPREKLTALASFCDANDISLGTVPDVFEILTTAPLMEDVEGIPMVGLKPTRFNALNRFVKRTFDIFLSIIGIIIFAFPMVIISLLIRIFSPGAPAIYKQERVGRGGEIFNLYKFRTMIPEAEKETGPVLSKNDDPRKTPLGRFLRSTNLDELPQLFNILKGDMSFVGPRPERPVFVKEFEEIIPKYMERHKIRPGLAGWAQLHGGYNMPAEEKIKYDLYYIENWSYVLDLKIILKYLQISFTLQRQN